MKVKYIGKCLLLEGEGERILVIGDMHLGYEEALNESGVFVSRELFREMINDLDSVFEIVGNIDRVILLGDVKHEFGRPGRQEWNDALELFGYLKKKIIKKGEIIVTKGNHDNYLLNIANKEGIKVENYFVFGDTGFLHGNIAYSDLLGLGLRRIIMAHWHPSITLEEGVKKEKYKCYYVGKLKGKEIIIVPSFVDYGGGADPRDTDIENVWEINLKKFDVKIVGEGLEVLDFGKLGKF